MDHKLARGMVRHEMRALQRGRDQARREITDLITNEAEKSMWRDRRMDAASLRALAERIDAVITERLSPVDRRALYRPGTAARPKSEAYEMMYAGVIETEVDGIRDKNFRLCSQRILATRKKIELNATMNGAGFYEHAARRMLERGGTAEVAIRKLAKAVLENAALLHWSWSTTYAGGKMGFAVPTEEGLLLGHATVVTDEDDGADWRRSIFNQRGMVRETLPAVGIATFEDISGRCDVKTFIHDDLMCPAQVRLKRLLLEWRRVHVDAVNVMNDALTWPGATMSAHDEKDLSKEELDRLLSRAEQSISSILGSETAREAIRTDRIEEDLADAPDSDQAMSAGMGR